MPSEFSYPPKAVALISGGLDSLLSARLMQEQGVYVEGLNFFTGFCVEGHTHAIRTSKQKRKPRRNNALWTAERLGIKLHILDIIEEYKDIVINPRHGYGAHLNPCLDCKVFMVKKAFQWMQEHDFDFIITGEVIGQRPMSQRKETLPVVQRESGVEDLLLRPLCALNLAPTRPEREGWVKREQLFDFSGRSRKPQIALAKSFGIEDFAQPAGGCCFLTDAAYSSKLQDLWQSRGERIYDLDDIMLLKVGRHLRPRPYFKMIVARDAGETNYLGGYRKRFVALEMTSHLGPLTLIDGTAESSDLKLAARVAARYGKGRSAKSVAFKVCTPNGAPEEIEVAPLSEGDIPKSWYI